jgi:hypothetical protein
MPDWQKIVQQRLCGLALDTAEKEEVHLELAAHLEESYATFREEGLPEKDAVHRTLAHVADWQDLQRRIINAKRRGYPMKKRTHQLWIPGFLTLILSMIFLAVLRELGFQPRIAGSGSTTVLLYVPWLLSLPFFGALGAYVSSRAGGSRRTVLLASVFPVLALTAAFLLMFPIGTIVEWIIGRHVDFSDVAPALLKDGIGWLLAPAAALLVGGLLAHLLFSRRSSSQDTAIS